MGQESQISKNDDKEQIKKIGEKGEAMNNMIAIVDKFCYISFTSNNIFYKA